MSGDGVRWSLDQFKNYQTRKGKPSQSDIPKKKDKAPSLALPVIPESVIQENSAEFLDRCLHRDWRWLHIPNEKGNRTDLEIMILARQGVKPGAADIMILSPFGRFYWVELKTAVGQLSKAQKKWREWHREHSLAWALCRSVEELMAFCERHQIPLRGRLV